MNEINGSDMSTEEAKYRSTLAELQELARNAPYVTQDWVLEVASMDPADMRRRLIRNYDWHEHFAHSLDGVEAIRNRPGAAPDGCWSHKEVRSVVMGLVAEIERLKASRNQTAEAPAVSVAATKDEVAELATQFVPGPQLYFLADYSHGHCGGCVLWYMPNARGYTPDIKQAGTHTAEEAKPHEGPDTVAVPVEWLHQNARIRMVVDAGDTHAVGPAFWSASKLREALAIAYP